MSLHSNPDIELYENFDTSDGSLILEKLISEIDWKQQEITIYGKKVLQPRLTAYFGENYTYSGLKLWNSDILLPKLLLRLKDAVEKKVGVVFNSVLLNYYRNGNDSIGFHSDDEIELGKEPVIAALSYGEFRELIFKSRRGSDEVKIGLNSGSLIVMRGRTQADWRHGILKTRKMIGPRVSVTFRKILSNV